MPSDALIYMNWQQMIRPDKIRSPATRPTASLSVNRCERGSGFTIGNALRRIISLRLWGGHHRGEVEGVMHEFSVVPACSRTCRKSFSI